MNKQRDVIYKERDKILKNEDLGETTSGTSSTRRSTRWRTATCRPAFRPPNGIWKRSPARWRPWGWPATSTEPVLEDWGTREAIVVNLKDIADERLEARSAEVGEDWPLLERLVLLRTIDSIWVEHLTELDEMRQGIGLRGLAQEDPLNAYKKEAHGLFEEMRALIRHQVASTIFRVQIVRQAPPPPVGVEGHGEEPVGAAAGSATGAAASGSRTEGSGAAAGSGGPGSRTSGGVVGGAGLPRALPAGRATGGSGDGAGGVKPGAVRPGYSPAGVRMGRNDPCWCGSGAKYKKCHGR